MSFRRMFLRVRNVARTRLFPLSLSPSLSLSLLSSLSLSSLSLLALCCRCSVWPSDTVAPEGVVREEGQRVVGGGSGTADKWIQDVKIEFLSRERERGEIPRMRSACSKIPQPLLRLSNYAPLCILNPPPSSSALSHHPLLLLSRSRGRRGKGGGACHPLERPAEVAYCTFHSLATFFEVVYTSPRQAHVTDTPTHTSLTCTALERV